MSESGTSLTDGLRHHVAKRATAIAAVVRLLLTAAGLLTGYYLLPLTQKPSGRVIATLIVGLVVVLALFVWQMRSIIRSPTPQLRAVQALATTVQLYLLLFASAYYLLERSDSGSFSGPLTRTASLYFTLVTFSSVGYGDIVARSDTARIITMVQMTCNLILLGVATRIAITAVQSGLRKDGTKHTDR
ncbi:potassium channel family protein [Streptomyces sp. NPDC051994]|uniref:potassium channel family protein n=1 Tax=unclassified Streptomyces TaxID=2593676 RepID=UPI00343D7F10